MQLLTISEAASTTNKSIQTIRRIIKQKKIQVRRQKTPQGFNYLIIKDSLFDYIAKTSQVDSQTVLDSQVDSREHRPITTPAEEAFKAEVDRFNTTIQRLIEQHEKDKSNLFELIKTFQFRAKELENQVKMLSAPKSNWWQFWK